MTGTRLDLLTRMHEQDPADAFCRYAIAQEHAKAGRTDEALHWFDATLEADADYCYAFFHKAKVLQAAGRVDDAITTLRTGLDRARASGDGHAAGEISGLLTELGA
ncbi:MAG: hypothetical protein RJA05_2180 [Planctomycetota bacterium]|jgi:tetratricopeptide (TPR) repeat protein